MQQSELKVSFNLKSKKTTNIYVLYVLYFVFYLLSFSSLCYGQNYPIKISLMVGESKTIPTDQPILVSKKGVIDVIDQNDSYLITGLKSGLVMISTTQQPIKKYLINVYKPLSKSSKSSLSNITSDIEKDTVFKNTCITYKLDCDYRLRIMRSKVDNILVWKKLKKLCLDTQCEFNVKLTQARFDELIYEIESKLDSTHRIKHIDQNMFIVSQCQKESKSSKNKQVDKKDIEFINYLTDGFIDKYKIPVVCSEEASQYYLKTSVVVLEESLLDKYDLSLENLLELSYTSFKRILQSTAVSKQAQMIAEPSLYLTSFTPTSIHSGEEFKFNSSIGTQTMSSEWKKTGIKMDFLITKEMKDSVDLSVSLDLATQDGASKDPSQLHSNAISSQINIPLGVSTLVGTTDVRMKTKNKSSILFLKNIPLISDLLSSSSKSSVKNKLFLWINIDKADINKADYRLDIIQ